MSSQIDVESFLSQVFTTTSVPRSELSTLLVSTKPSSLYFAILEYASFCKLPASSSLSISLSPTNPPLFIHPRDSAEPDQLDPLDDCDTSKARTRLSLFNPFFATATDKEIDSLKKYNQHVQFKYKFGYGPTAFIWPPPDELEGKQLATNRTKNENESVWIQIANNVKKKVEVSNDTNHVNCNHINSVDQETVYRDGNLFGVDHRKVSASLQATLENTIYMLHYTTGDPLVDCHGMITRHTEVLLVTAAKDGQDLLRSFCMQVVEWKIEKDKRETGGKGFSLYRFMTDASDGWWENEGTKRSRSPSSVILPEGQMEDILKDISKFLDYDTRKWYIYHGLPHRRCYLFHGPPGTGKTSTIRSIASKFNFKCCFLSMTNSNFSNQMLANAIAKLPSNALLVLEDVDALFNIDRKSESNNNLTFSGLLNVLDGVISADRIVTFMTTNFVERLDQAMIRGGRVDRHFYFPLPSAKELQRLFICFYPKAEEKIARKFADKVLKHGGKDGRSVASLQQLFIKHREDSAEECVDGIESFFKDFFACRSRNTDTIYT